MPDLKPYIVLGLAVGGVFSLSGVGIVVLYRATAVLNLAYGAIGAVGALLAYSLTTGVGLSTWLSVAIVVVFCGMLSLLYGTFFGAAFALREPLVKMIGTLGVLLILLGAMSMIWTSQAYSLTLPTTNWSFQVSGVNVTGTQLIGLVLGVAVTAATAALLRYTKLGAGMRALADDRQAAAILGVPVRRVEAAAWLASGLLAGVTGVLLSNLVAFDAADHIPRRPSARGRCRRPPAVPLADPDRRACHRRHSILRDRLQLRLGLQRRDTVRGGHRRHAVVREAAEHDREGLR
jgi:branched-chain amino acid transport system permease protein